MQNQIDMRGAGHQTSEEGDLVAAMSQFLPAAIRGSRIKGQTHRSVITQTRQALCFSGTLTLPRTASLPVLPRWAAHVLPLLLVNALAAAISESLLSVQEVPPVAPSGVRSAVPQLATNF